MYDYDYDYDYGPDSDWESVSFFPPILENQSRAISQTMLMVTRISTTV